MAGSHCACPAGHELYTPAPMRVLPLAPMRTGACYDRAMLLVATGFDVNIERLDKDDTICDDDKTSPSEDLEALAASLFGESVSVAAECEVICESTELVDDEEDHILTICDDNLCSTVELPSMSEPTIDDNGLVAAECEVICERIEEDEVVCDDQKTPAEELAVQSNEEDLSPAPVSLVCNWRNCDWPGSFDDLVDHIREIHVELQPYHNMPTLDLSTLRRGNSKSVHQSGPPFSSSSLCSSSSFASSSSSSSSTTASSAPVSPAELPDGDDHPSLETTSTSAAASCTTSRSSSHSDTNAVPFAWEHLASQARHSSQHQKALDSRLRQSDTSYVCLWEGCKVFGKRSQSRAWLERHVLIHSGDKPFKCIVAGCGNRFKSQGALEKHVNAHFNSSSGTKDNGSLTGENADLDDLCCDGPTMCMMRAKCQNGHCSSSTGGTPSKLANKRKKMEKRCVKKKNCLVKGTSEDFFDASIMEQIQYRLYQLKEAVGVGPICESRSITFHSAVTAIRKEESGCVRKLLHWTPENYLSDEWVSESEEEDHKTRTVPLSLLPCKAASNLFRNNDTAFSSSPSTSTSQPQSSSRRKQRRK